MKARPTNKAKPFRLVKYFTITALIVIFIGAVVLSLLNIRWARSTQLEKSKEYARVLVENLNHQVFQQFVLPIAIRFGKIQLRDKEQFERMDKVVRSTLHSFQVEQVNIYDQKHIISYSYDKDLIGKSGTGGSGYDMAMKGEIASKLIRKGGFWQTILGVQDTILLITFAPLRAETLTWERQSRGPVLGVVEIEQDLSRDYKRIFVFQTRIVLTSAGVMLGLLLSLIWIVRKGEKIMGKRAEEQIRLKDELARARHLSSLGELTAGISHEIRNPLGIIRSSASLLKKKMKVVDAGNTIPDIILEESERLNHIITDFLNYARPRKPDFRPCRIEEILTKNLTFLEPELAEHGHRVQTDFAPDLPEIMGDEDMLYQAFLNLLINAMQSGSGKANIRIRAFRRDRQIIIVLEDDGSGIPTDQLEHIWDPFFTTKETGTGLGLGIVKNILEAHNGEITIENRKTTGVRVTAGLPIRRGE